MFSAWHKNAVNDYLHNKRFICLFLLSFFFFLHVRCKGTTATLQVCLCHSQATFRPIEKSWKVNTGVLKPEPLSRTTTNTLNSDVATPLSRPLFFNALPQKNMSNVSPFTTSKLLGAYSIVWKISSREVIFSFLLKCSQLQINYIEKSHSISNHFIFSVHQFTCNTVFQVEHFLPQNVIHTPYFHDSGSTKGSWGILQQLNKRFNPVDKRIKKLKQSKATTTKTHQKNQPTNKKNPKSSKLKE